ncbi:MAG: hypothetical protein UT24_C0022G0008 [Candidatus Woesebacteria bacterium GW2011_GWB1_39_12]|uniref:Uncharacterized protein n=1 Tax=Candidatus Woesebacteria bacterium GW2011_GWB1_39_12 TaxID=1618574 RepID=A0A0G0M9G3_9BACT|nr:MAG: hypothetical protein UT24_C0022G0008 [Candidatus Woesebacteria bacterium GW2011_GWB1_39_12]
MSRFLRNGLFHEVNRRTAEIQKLAEHPEDGDLIRFNLKKMKQAHDEGKLSRNNILNSIALEVMFLEELEK